mgnify:CR=1 FL=1
MNLSNNQKKGEDFESGPEKLVDEIAEKVVEFLGKNKPIRRIRNSQILSALIGAVGFALFIDGIVKLFANFSGWVSLAVGFVLMAVTGLLLRNLYR